MNEREARDAIVRYAELLWERRLVAGNSGNVSVRLDDGTLLVTPTGRSLRDLAPDELVRTSATGEALASGKPTSELPLHVAAYRTRPDVRCVIHTHPTYCVAWSKTGTLFALDTVGAIESLGPIAWTRYAKSGTAELADVCAAAFAAEADTIVMERHGLSSAAADLETAFLRTDLAEQTAQIEFAARALGVPQRPNVPVARLRAAAGDDASARDAIEDFHAEFASDRPDVERLRAGVERLRRYPAVVGAFERWWMDPHVQAFLAELGATGI
jgi:ribulose-5-phosphate 4-epimerase/fuculose-1-phosphate aldolase